MLQYFFGLSYAFLLYEKNLPIHQSKFWAITRFGISFLCGQLPRKLSLSVLDKCFGIALNKNSSSWKETERFRKKCIWCFRGFILRVWRCEPAGGLVRHAHAQVCWAARERGAPLPGFSGEPARPEDTAAHTARSTAAPRAHNTLTSDTPALPQPPPAVTRNYTRGSQPPPRLPTCNAVASSPSASDAIGAIARAIRGDFAGDEVTESSV